MLVHGILAICNPLFSSYLGPRFISSKMYTILIGLVWHPLWTLNLIILMYSYHLLYYLSLIKSFKSFNIHSPLNNTTSTWIIALVTMRGRKRDREVSLRRRNCHVDSKVKVSVWVTDRLWNSIGIILTSFPSIWQQRIILPHHQRI